MKTTRSVAWRAVFILGLTSWWGAGAAFAQDSAQRITRLEKQLIDLINAERRRGGLAVLQMDPTLSQAAREHSVDMARRGVATHESPLPDHQTPEDRFQWAFGASAAKLTENVAVVKSDLVESAVTSSAHAALNGNAAAHHNSVDREVSIVGLGCAEGPDGRIWITAMFARLAGQGATPSPPTIAATPAPAEAEPPGAERLEDLLVRAINEESGSLMLVAVSAQTVDPLLRQAAREHSGEMMHRNLVAHESQIPGHGTPMDRYEWAHGTVPDTPAGSAETVGLYEIVTAAPAAPEKKMVDAIMTVLRGGSRESIKSKRESEWPEEYRRMRDVNLKTLGVGCAVGSDGRYWVTVMYAARPKSILDYVGTLSKDFAELADAVLDGEAGARAGAAQEGRPVKKFEVQWRGNPIHKGDPLPIELRVVRDEKSTTTYGWGGQLSLDVEAGDLNTTEGRFVKADYEFNGKAGKMEPDGRLVGVYQGKGSMLGTEDRANSRQPEGFWSDSPETQGTWEAVSPDPTRREYQLFVTTEKGRMLAGTLRRKGAPPAEEVAAGLPAATAATAPVPPRTVEAEAPAQSEDENRAADIRWLGSIDDALAAAERKKNEATGKLVLIKEAIHQWEDRVAYLGGLLKETSTPQSENCLEELIRLGLDNWDSATMGPPPTMGAEPRAVIQGQIARLQQQVNDARREQDELIQQTLETYCDTITQELEARGPQSNWDEVKTMAKNAVKDAAAIKGLAAADLYLAAGQDEKFREAAQACIADGRFAADARYMEAVYFLGKHDMRQALEGFRRVMALTTPPQGETAATKGDSLWQQARAMSSMIEVGYLQAIDAKASGEAAEVRIEASERLKKGGDEGWLGYVLGYLKMGVVSATSQIVGREDALQDLASSYQNNVAAQHLGLLVMQSLRERGVPLDDIDGMSNQEFLATIRSKYAEAGQQVGAQDAVRLRAAIKAALANPDVNRLVSGSKQMLRVDTGRDYFGHDALAETDLEAWGDVVNMANVATMLMPMSTLRVSGKLAKIQYTGVLAETREAGAVVQTAREGFTAATGLNKLPALLAETKAGQTMLAQTGQFLANSTWTERRALEMTTFLVASKTGEAAGGTIGVMTGADGKTTAEAGRMLAELFTMCTVGDADALKEAAAAHGISPEQLEAVANEAEQTAKAAEEVGAAGERHLGSIREGLPSEPGAGISAEGRRAAGRTKEEIERELNQALADIGQGKADANTFRRIDELELACKATVAVEGGAEAQARAWMEFLEQRVQNAGTKKVEAAAAATSGRESAASLPNQETVKPRAGEALADKAVPVPANMRDIPSFRTGNSITADLDRMVIEGKRAEALAGYQRRLAVCQQLKVAGNKHVMAAELSDKIVYVKKMIQSKWRASQWRNPEELGHLRPVTPEEVARLDADPSVMKIPVKPVNPSYTDPYWVMGRRSDGTYGRVGIFKPPGGDFRAATAGYPAGGDLRAEVVYADLAQALGNDVPAATLAKMTIKGQVQEGVFIRVASGTPLLELGIGGPAVFKGQIAEDRVLALWLGDHDRHLGNYMVTSTGEVRCIDHGMADIAGKTYGENAADATNDTVRKAMERRLEILRKPGDPKTSYGLWWVDDQMTVEDMLPMIQKIQNLMKHDEARVINMLEKTLQGRELQDALNVLRRRADVLEQVVRENFGTVGNLKPIPFSTAALFRLRRPEWFRRASPEALALAA